ncbi:MAG: hypothetical protein HDQ88_05455 [Clostridia bacterium]|nr:hypothetical protein [Clostridia bacterium]
MDSNTELVVSSLDVGIMNAVAQINAHVMLNWSERLRRYFDKDEGDGNTPRSAALDFIDDELIELGSIGDRCNDEPIMAVYKKCLKKLKKRLIVFTEFIEIMKKLDDNHTFWYEADDFVTDSMELVKHNLRLIKCYWDKCKKEKVWMLQNG